jgi:hypothetical protein
MDERGVMVTRDDDYLTLAAQARPECTKRRLGDLHSALLLSLEQLDHVAEQDELLDSLERIQQSSQWLGASEHIAPQTRAEVEI